MKIIHLTDLHLVAPTRKLFALDPLEHFKAAIASINLNHFDAELVLISGDLVDQGETEAYIALKEALKSLKIPYALGMGNHDNRAHLQSVFPELPQDDNGFVQYAIKTSGGTFIMLDTAKEGSHAGELCTKRLAWLSHTLEKHSDQDIFIVLHHPTVETGIRFMDSIKLQDVEAFANIVKKHNNIRHLFFGHVHRPITGNWQGISFSLMPSLNHQAALNLEIDAKRLPGSHEPPAYGVVIIEEQSLVVHFNYFMQETRKYFVHGNSASAQSFAQLDHEIELQQRDDLQQTMKDY